MTDGSVGVEDGVDAGEDDAGDCCPWDANGLTAGAVGGERPGSGGATGSGTNAGAPLAGRWLVDGR